MNRKFENFDLEFSRAAEGYTARVLSSPGGEGSQAFTVPIDEIQLENVVLQVLAARSVRSISSKPGTRLRNVGGALFKSVFAGEVLQCYLRSLGAVSDGTGLRMRLRFVGTPELVNLPWELLYDEGVDQWVALKLDTPLVRYLRMPAQIAPLRVSGPLHVLIVVSSPSDVPLLDVESETAAVEAALRTLGESAPGSVVTQTLRHPTPELLQRKLMEQPWNVLHFIGHGEFDERTQMGMLVLEDERGKARPITAERLSVMLQGRSLKLVILNSCEGSRGGEDNRSGLTQSLIAQGVPAVIAMQFPITDLAALAFSRMFYHALVLGSPLEDAVVEARRAIFQESELEWATPTLYLRADNGLLFDRPDPGVAMRAALQTVVPRIENVVEPVVPKKQPLLVPDEVIAKPLVPDKIQPSTVSDEAIAKPLVPEEPLLRTVPDDVLTKPDPPVKPDPIDKHEPIPKPEPVPPIVPWWKKPFVIPVGLVALLAIFFVVPHLSPAPSPEPSPSPSPLADVSTAPFLASAEPSTPPATSPATPIATHGASSSNTYHFDQDQLFGITPTVRSPMGVCPMLGAGTSDSFETNSHLWGMPSTATIAKGYLVLTLPKNRSQQVTHSGTLTRGTVCTAVQMGLSDPTHHASDDSAAGLSFWYNGSGYWAFFATPNGHVRISQYSFKSKAWKHILESRYTVESIRSLFGRPSTILTASLAGGKAWFYVNGTLVGTASGGPSGPSQSGLIAETGENEPHAMKWFFGEYGVRSSN